MTESTLRNVKRWVFLKVPETANARLRTHWRDRSRESKTWRLLVRAICGVPRDGEVPSDGKIRIGITMTRRRRQDPDNRQASVKPLLDAIVKAGWLVDDDDEHLELSVEEVLGGRPETVITWEKI